MDYDFDDRNELRPCLCLVVGLPAVPLSILVTHISFDEHHGRRTSGHHPHPYRHSASRTAEKRDDLVEKSAHNSGTLAVRPEEVRSVRGYYFCKHKFRSWNASDST